MDHRSRQRGLPKSSEPGVIWRFRFTFWYICRWGLKSPRRKPDRIRSLRRPATISGGVPPADSEAAAAQEPTGSTHGCIGVRRALLAVSPMLPGAHRVDQEKVNIMRIILIATLAIAPLLAKDNEPAKRLQEASAVFSEIMDTPDKGIPQELLENAHCIVIVPNLKTAAFFFGAKYGKGVLSCRNKGGAGWSAPGTVRIEGG